MRQSRISCLIAGLGILSVACGRDPDPTTVERVDSAGVAVVLNAAPDSSLNWTFTEIFSLGGGSLDAHTFFRRSAAADRDGNIYVLDRGNHRVVVFDSAGSYLRTLSREGNGPGELGLPIALAVTPNGQVSVYDVSKHGLVNFAPDGSLMSGEPLRASYVGGKIERSATVLAATVSENGPVLGSIVQRVWGTQSGDTVEFLRLVKQAPTPVTLQSCGVQLQDLPPLFQPALVWTLGDSVLYSSTTSEYVINVLMRGNLVASYRRSVPPQEATLELAVAEIGEGMRFGNRFCTAEDIARQVGYARVIPVIADIRVAPDGKLWVKRYFRPDVPAQIDILNESGSYMGTLPSGSPFPVAFLPDEKAVVEEVDESGVEKVTVYAISRF